MKDPRHLSVEAFTYSLPEEKIARFPLAQRDASKLLIYKNGFISEDLFRNLDKYIPAGSLLVFNDTRVIEARLLFRKPTGGVIEIFCLEPHEQCGDMATAMNCRGQALWYCFIGGASKWKPRYIPEKKIKTGNRPCTLQAKFKEKLKDRFLIEFSWDDSSLTFAEVLHGAGAIPLPPYLKREADASDAERYQTVYARQDGSVAAPTAGLHFTEEVLKRLQEKKTETASVTLHVGAGTFKPVQTSTLAGHDMHAEFFVINRSLIESLLHFSGQNIIAVGTTTLRTLESIYWLGVKYLRGCSDSFFSVSQWEAYDAEQLKIPVQAALQGLLDYMEKKQLSRLQARTQLLVAPGYRIRNAHALITNFHLPQSTLLLLVAACIGDDWQKVYQYALQNNFRFLSYGDSSLLWIDQPG
jgi:S-adenosylmethionine:tRNA ribosyltransferase-isomerase